MAVSPFVWVLQKIMSQVSVTEPVFCADCKRQHEQVEPAKFGDFSLCDRCHRPVNSLDKAFTLPR